MCNRKLGVVSKKKVFTDSTKGYKSYKKLTWFRITSLKGFSSYIEHLPDLRFSWTTKLLDLLTRRERLLSDLRNDSWGSFTLTMPGSLGFRTGGVAGINHFVASIILGLAERRREGMMQKTKEEVAEDDVEDFLEDVKEGHEGYPERRWTKNLTGGGVEDTKVKYMNKDEKGPRKVLYRITGVKVSIKIIFFEILNTF